MKTFGGKDLIDMPNRKNLYLLCVLAIGVCFFSVKLCLGTAYETAAVFENTVSDAEYTEIYKCTRADLDTEAKDVMEIDLSKKDSDLLITDAGSYLLYGDYEGQVCIDAEEQIVHLFLKNADIQSPAGPAIDIRAAGKVIITLMEGTSNSIQDKAYYRRKDEGDAAIYSNSDLTVNGDGALSVHGLYDKGIHSRDVVKILGGDIFVEAKGHGIQGNDGMRLSPAALSIESEGHGLYSRKAGEGGKGAIEITGGSIRIIAGENAVSSSGVLYVSDCSFWSNSILDAFHVSGARYITEGCVENE